MESPNQPSPYERLVTWFAAAGTPYRESEHPPAASAAAYHEAVGSRLAQQAKRVRG
jgi:hypothetical protein